MISVEINQERAIHFEDCPELQFVQTLLTEEERLSGVPDPLLAHVPEQLEDLMPPTVTSLLRRALGSAAYNASEIVRQDKTYFCGQEAVRIYSLLERAAYDVDIDEAGVTKRHPEYNVALAILDGKKVVERPVHPLVKLVEPDRYPTQPLPPVDDYLDHRFDLRSPYTFEPLETAEAHQAAA